jgi:hypothetical protein
MKESLALAQIPLGSLSKIGDLLGLIGDIRNITAPLTTADGLRQTLALILKMADMLGIDPTWTNRLASILSDNGVFNVVLAIIQYLTGVAGAQQADNTIRVRIAVGEPEVIVDETAFTTWLPLVLQLLGLLRQIRGNQ